MARKYLKFGLRADKNLADLTDRTSALNNVLDGLDKGIVDVFGTPVGFTVEDIVPLQALSSTDIDKTIPSDGTIPEAWRWLKGEVDFESVQNESGVSRNVDIEPLVTLQDDINKFKSILGDPPFIGGGTGPITKIISSNRMQRYSPGDENEKTDAVNIKQGSRYRIENLGSPAISDTLWNNISTTTGSGYTQNDIFIASASVINFFSFDDLDDENDEIKLGKNHGLQVGQEVKFLENGGTPTTDNNLTNDSNYFIVASNQANGTVQLGPTANSQPVNFTKPDSGNGDDYTLTLLGYETSTGAKVRNVTMPSGGFKTRLDDISVRRLGSNSVYTEVESISLTDIILELDFWSASSNTIVRQTGLVRPQLPDHFVALQFEGYMERNFNQSIVSNGFLVFEQDLIEDGTDNNWELIRGCNTDRLRVIHPTSWGPNNAGTSTVLTFSNEEDVKRIAPGMRVELNADAYYAAVATDASDLDAIKATEYVSGTIGTVNVGEKTATISGTLKKVDPDNDPATPEVDATGSNSLDVRFSWDLGQDLNWGNMAITKPIGNRRRRIRFTVWWPDRFSDSSLYSIEDKARDISNTTQKTFLAEGGNSFTAKNFYTTQNNQDFSQKRYSFPYFRDSRASVLQQNSDNELKAQYTVKNLYEPVKSVDNVCPFYDPTSQTYGARGRVGIITVGVKANGEMDYSDVDIVGASNVQQLIGLDYAPVVNNTLIEIGDIMISHNDSTGSYHAFKILANEGGSFIVDPDYLTHTGQTENTAHSVLIVKNQGLHGIYKYTHDGSNNTITQINQAGSSLSYHVNEVKKDDFIFKANYDDTANIATHTFDGAARKYVPINQLAFKLETIDHEDSILSTTTSANFTVSPHAEASNTDYGASLTTTSGILLAYSSKGLNDRSSTAECTDVFGHEVASTANAGDTSLVLKSVEGISQGDIVHLDGTIPFSEADPTVVGVVNSAAKSITLVNGGGAISGGLTQSAPPGTTVVFVPADAGPANDGWAKKNKEYCVAPLNTAPPWASTADGLETPDAFPNITTSELRFSDLNLLSVPTNCITEYDSQTSPLTASKHIIIKH